MGGTGANHIMLGTGDAIWFSDDNGNPLPPSPNVTVAGTPHAGTVDEIEDLYPRAGRLRRGTSVHPLLGADHTYPDTSGAFTVLECLSSLPNLVDSRCESRHYYLLNNNNPGYFGDGSNAYTDNSVNKTPFTIPPSSVRKHSIEPRKGSNPPGESSSPKTQAPDERTRNLL